MSVMDPLLRMGRAGGLLLLTAGGACFVVFGVELVQHGEGHVLFPGIGLALVLLGAMRLALRTSEERIADLIAEDEEERPTVLRPVTAGWLQAAPLPLYVCTQCRIQLDAEVICPKCQSSAWCASVEVEGDRAIVLAAVE